MAALRRYLFDRSFDPVDPPPRADDTFEETGFVDPPEPPAPTFSEEELMEARARGYAEGEAAGREAAEASAEHRLSVLMSDLGGQMSRLVEAQVRTDSEIQTQAAELALAVVRRMFPHLTRRHGLGEIEAVVRDCLGGLLSEPKLAVRVAPENEPVLAPRLSALAEELGFDGHVVVRAQEGLGLSDCRIGWSEGGAERLCDDLWQSIETAIADLFGETGDDRSPPHEPASARVADAMAGA